MCRGFAYPPLEGKGRSRSDRGGATVSQLVHCWKGGTATPPRRSFHSRRPSPSRGGSEAGRPGMTRGNNAFHRPSRRTTPIGNEARVPGIAYPPLEGEGRSRSDRGGVTVSQLVHCSKGGTATPHRRSFHSRRPSPSRGGSEAGRPGMTTGNNAFHCRPRRTAPGFAKVRRWGNQPLRRSMGESGAVPSHVPFKKHGDRARQVHPHRHVTSGVANPDDQIALGMTGFDLPDPTVHGVVFVIHVNRFT